jgi:diacylglycerol kinase family enzyme
MIVILNSGAGASSNTIGGTLRSRVTTSFEAAGIAAEIVELGSDDLPDTVRKAVHSNSETIVAAGGDGTVSAVAAQLAGTNKTLGVLPLGTLNHFAKAAGIPIDLQAAVRTLADGRTELIDVAEVNGHVFLNNSSLGVYPRIVVHRENLQQQLNRGKWPAFAWATVLALRRYPFLHLRVCIEGRELHRKTGFLFVGNNEYDMSGFRIGARGRLNTGTLGLYLTHRTGRFGLVRLALRALFGRLNQAKDFDAFSVEEAIIESRHRRLLVATDGEVTHMQPPLHYRSRPRALRVIVPARKACAP